MIRRRTTLILGAGASLAYGYPSGVQLRDELLQKLQGLENHLLALEYGPDVWSRAQQSLLRSQFQSVDDFLERYPEHAEVMKLAVTYLLNNRENVDSLLDPRRKDHWYNRLFFDYLDGDAALGGGILSVVTFNYDISLETYIYETLLARNRLSPAEAVRAMSNLPIVHVYGDLGPHAHLAGHGRLYESFRTVEQLRDSARGISTCHEPATREAVAVARRYICESEAVGIMGFGFSKQNLDLLRLEDGLREDVEFRATDANGRAEALLRARVGEQARVIAHGLQRNHADVTCRALADVLQTAVR
jgi:hypothetical protein